MIEAVQSLLDEFGPHYLRFFLYAARPLGMIAVFPVFLRAGLLSPVRSATALVLAIPAFAVGADQDFDISELERPFYMVLVLKEALIGVVVGIVAGLPIWAFQACGEILEYQRQAGNGSIADPTQGGEVSATANYFSLIAVAIFLIGGGLQKLLLVLYATIRAWPVASLSPDWPFLDGAFLLAGTRYFFSLAVYFAFPLLAFMLLSAAALVITNKFSGKMGQAVDVFLFQNIVFVFGLAAFALIFLPSLQDAFDTLLDAMLQWVAEKEGAGNGE